ncbi:response regulator [Pantoea sp. KPR_PJ]|uniref:response regulator n=1 Tax=Pantoea sp. KPR_PJ TaxID=2738375 RepID=UPI0035279F57
MLEKRRTLRVGVSDESPFIECSVQSTLATEFTRHEIVSFPAEPDELIFSLKKEKPDILITDFNFSLEHSGLNGVKKIEEILKQVPDINIIILTAQTNQAVLKKLMQIPVKAVISKRDDRRELIKAFRWICTNNSGTYYSEQMKPLAQDSFSGEIISLLSPAEIEVIRLFALGYSLVDIAKARKRSVSTVATQKYNAMRKLQLQSNTDLIKYVFAQELI